MNTRDHLMHAIRHYKAPTMLAKFVLILLATYANRLGENVYPGWNTLIDQTQASRSSITRAIKALILDGILIKVSGGNNHRPGQYRINIDKLKPSLVVVPQSTTNEEMEAESQDCLNLVVLSQTSPDGVVVLSQTLPIYSDARASETEERITEEKTPLTPQGGIEGDQPLGTKLKTQEQPAELEPVSSETPLETSVVFEQPVSHEEENPESIDLPELVEQPQLTTPAERSEELTSLSCEASAEPLNEPSSSPIKIAVRPSGRRPLEIPPLVNLDKFLAVSGHEADSHRVAGLWVKHGCEPVGELITTLWSIQNIYWDKAGRSRQMRMRPWNWIGNQCWRHDLEDAPVPRKARKLAL